MMKKKQRKPEEDRGVTIDPARMEWIMPACEIAIMRELEQKGRPDVLGMFEEIDDFLGGYVDDLFVDLFGYLDDEAGQEEAALAPGSGGAWIDRLVSPRLYDVCEGVLERLGVRPKPDIELYVGREGSDGLEGLTSASCGWIGGTAVICVAQTALAHCDGEELAFLVGREAGRACMPVPAWLGSYEFFVRRLEDENSRMAMEELLLDMPMDEEDANDVVLGMWERRERLVGIETERMIRRLRKIRTMTCDRFGLLACGTPEAAVRALARLETAAMPAAYLELDPARYVERAGAASSLWRRGETGARRDRSLIAARAAALEGFSRSEGFARLTGREDWETDAAAHERELAALLDKCEAMPTDEDVEEMRFALSAVIRSLGERRGRIGMSDMDSARMTVLWMYGREFDLVPGSVFEAGTAKEIDALFNTLGRKIRGRALRERHGILVRLIDGLMRGTNAVDPHVREAVFDAGEKLGLTEGTIDAYLRRKAPSFWRARFGY
ncbi:MAG: hypothetical protein ABIJ56_07755 [Pseudomonadota bacterium]